jgi:4-amino-4-deoxy-L-arabinose transferase-like glycosyltransferase
MENSADSSLRAGRVHSWGPIAILAALGVVIFLGTIFSPPSLMDEVDSVAAHIGQKMLETGDWVTPRINGVVYLEKSPLNYWLVAASYFVFGVHDWAARLPVALGSIALILLVATFGRWAFGPRGGFYSGLAIGSCVGLFLFTRIIIPDVLLTFSITAALFFVMRALDDGRRIWALGYGAAIGAGLLLKGLIAAVFPVAIVAVFLLCRRELWRWETIRRLRLHYAVPAALVIAVPWFVMAILANPPQFDFTMESQPGVYRGFFWFYVMNEHVLRFLGMRYPKDYDTVPRIAFLLLHAVWIFPWTVFLPAAVRERDLSGRAGAVRLMCFIWIGFLVSFFLLSTTQEYYTMPCYPAFALLVGWALAFGAETWIRGGYNALAGLGAAGAVVTVTLLAVTVESSASGSIASALTHNPDAYRLSLGHISDLTVESMAYLKLPLALFGVAFFWGTLTAWIGMRRGWAPEISAVCLAAAMAMMFHAAHAAMQVFEPVFSTRSLADVIRRGPPGELIIDGHFYPASAAAYYLNQKALLLDGKRDNMVYGAAAPGAPAVFLDANQFRRHWNSGGRFYLISPCRERVRIQEMADAATLVPLAEAGEKCLFTNKPVAGG